jgi:membrane-bound ClpP family serine protease
MATMATKTLSDEELLRRLQAHPQLRNRMESLLLVVENAAGDLKEADAAEMRVIEEIRRMGQEALTAWATQQVEKSSDELSQRRGVWREGKKNCAGTQRLARSK